MRFIHRLYLLTLCLWMGFVVLQAQDTPPPAEIVINGIAQLQHPDMDRSTIVIELWQTDTLLANSDVTESGVFQLTVSQPGHYQLHVDAAHHLEKVVFFSTTETIPLIVLAGGDLNDDGCVNETDLAQMSAAFDTVSPYDLTGDTLVQVEDLVILAGNFNEDCIPLVPASPEHITPETTAVPEATVEITPELTPVPEATAMLPVTVTIEVTAEITPEPERTVLPELTPDTSPAPSLEATEDMPVTTNTPTPITTETASSTIAPEATAELTATAVPTETATVTQTTTASATATQTATATGTASPTASITASSTATSTVTPSPALTATMTATLTPAP